MARTRNASAAFHRDDGEALDKEGKPLALNPHGAPGRAASFNTGVVHMDDGEIVSPAPKETVRATADIPIEYEFVCDRATIRRDLDAYELMLLFEQIVGPVQCRLKPAQFSALSADLRRHFRRVVAQAPSSIPDAP